MTTKILVVDDDIQVAESLKDFLEAKRYEVEMVHDGEEAKAWLKERSYDLLILDWHLPGINGIDLCKLIRMRGIQTPVLMLTAADAPDDKVKGLECGADDYLTKPFYTEELLARVKALLRRPPGIAATQYEVAGVILDSLSRKVKLNGEEVHLKPLEFDLLEYFLKNPDQVITAETLLSRVWKNETEASTQAVYTRVNQLRTKLKMQGKNAPLRTVHKMGYIFSVD